MVRLSVLTAASTQAEKKYTTEKFRLLGIIGAKLNSPIKPSVSYSEIF